MKTKLIALSVLVVVTIFVIAQSLPISQFPNTGTPNDSDLFVLAQTQSPRTNKNIRYDQLRGAIRSGLATEAYVNAVSNAIVSSGGSNFVVVLSGTNTLVVNTTTNGTNFYAVNTATSSGTGFEALETLTNGVRIGLSTNQNWSFGVTGHVSGTTVRLGVDARAISNVISGAFTDNVGNTNLHTLLYAGPTNGAPKGLVLTNIDVASSLPGHFIHGPVMRLFTNSDQLQMVMYPPPGWFYPSNRTSLFIHDGETWTYLGDKASVTQGVQSAIAPTAQRLPAQSWVSAATTSSNGGFGGNLIYQAGGFNMELSARIRISNTNSCRFFFGVTKETFVAVMGTDAGTENLHTFGFRFKSGVNNNNFLCAEGDAFAPSFSTADTGVLADNETHLFQIFWVAVTGGETFYYLDGAYVGTTSVIRNVGVSDIHRIACGVQTLENVAKGIEVEWVQMRIGP